MKDKRTNEDKRKELIRNIMQELNEKKRVKREQLIGRLFIEKGVNDETTKKALLYMEVLGYIVFAGEYIYLPTEWDRVNNILGGKENV